MKLHFIIRDLLWLTTLCAVLVAWWLNRTRQEKIHAAEIHQLSNQVHRAIENHRSEMLEHVKRAIESAGKGSTADDIMKQLQPETF